MKIAIISGSLRNGRHSHKVAVYLQKLIESRNISTDLIDLAEEHLPLLEDKTGVSQGIENRVQKLSSRLSAADGLILVTPEYHGSFSGVLKNALDYFWAEFQRKPIGVAAVSAGKMAGINASTQLQHVILSLGAFPLPIKLLVGEVHNSFDEFNVPLNDGITNSAKTFLDQFIWFTEAITDKKNTEESTLINL